MATDTVHGILVSLLGQLSYLVAGLTDLKALRLLVLGPLLPVKLTRRLLATESLLASLKLLIAHDLISSNASCVIKNNRTYGI